MTPDDELGYRPIHNLGVQAKRHARLIPCGPGGVIHDYVPFYFGPLSVMLLNLKTGRVPGYTEGQEPLLYLRTTAQAIQQAGARFVFSDGHGLAGFTDWYDDLARLNEVDWDTVETRWWRDTPEDNDRQRRKQAEFLVWHSLDWSLISDIAVLSTAMKQRVENLLNEFAQRARPPVVVMPDWYY